ncbi:hypothetical protein DV737_g2691, partial [Chaetothyriales sp. CBS 132003]
MNTLSPSPAADELLIIIITWEPMANVPANVPPKTLSWLWAVVGREYRDPRRTYSDLAHTLSRYPSLAPRTDVYTFENGTHALLVRLVGTVPVNFRGTVYRFPIALWIPHAYPYEPPMVYVTPTDDMVVRQGQHVAGDGRIYHHYLAHWPQAWDRSHVADLLTILSGIFANEPPPPPRPPLPYDAAQLPRSGTPAQQQPGAAAPRPPPKQLSAQEERPQSPAQARLGRYEAPLPLPQQPQSPVRPPSMYSEHPQSNGSVPKSKPNHSLGLLSLKHSLSKDKGHSLASIRTWLVKVININCLSIMSRLRLSRPSKHHSISHREPPVQPLQSQNAALQSTIPRLQAELASLSALQDTLKSNISLLQESLSSADQTISAARQRAAAGDIPKVDDMLVPPHVVGKQLYDTVTEERGVETAIFALHDAFVRGRISSDVWSRKTRELAREGFKKRYLSRKIGVGMGLEA